MTTYVKKTWVSNEVITTAAMNNIETGIEDSFKTSEMLGDGTLDMSGNGISNATYIYSDTHKSSASDDIIYTDDTAMSLSGTSGTGVYLKIAEYVSPSALSPSSVVRVVVTAKANQPPAYIKTYIGGVDAGSEHSLTTLDANYSDDITITGGNLIQIYGKVIASGTTISISNVDVKYIDPFRGFVKNSV